jgi:hypothetical protein
VKLTPNPTRKVALYQSQYGSTMLLEVTKDPDRAPLEGWARVSEVLEITVTPLPPAAVLAGQLRALYAIRETTAREFGNKLADIDARIESLRALPAPTGGA